MKYYYRRDFFLKLVKHEGTVKEFQRPYAIKDAVFNVECPLISVTEKRNLHRASRKMWPAILISEVASVEKEFAGFKVCNKDTFHEMVSILQKLDPSMLNVNKNKVDVVEWIDAGKGIVVSRTIADGDN
jgi:hypothetical protein